MKTVSLLMMAAAVSASAQMHVGPRGNHYEDPAGAVYVATNGSDSASGTVSAPYKTINRALTAVSPGGTVVLCGGVYREGRAVNVRKSNVTLKSRQGEWAVIDLTTCDSGREWDSCVEFYAEDQTLGGVVRGCTLQALEAVGGFYAVSVETQWDWPEPGQGLPPGPGSSNIIIEDCILHDSRYDVVKVKPHCTNIVVRYNEIYNSGRAFVGNPTTGEDNAEGIDNVNGNNMLVQNNHIHDIRGNGIYAKGGATDVLIENNIIEHVYGAGVMVGFDTSPDFFDLAVNPQWYENIRGIVRNNLIMDIGWEGIGFYGSLDAEVYNNTLVNVNNGIYHSAIYFGLTYQDWEPYAGRPATVNPSIHHNVVCQPNAFSRAMIEIRYSNDLGGMSALAGNPAMDYNCYYIAGKSAVFVDTRPGRTLNGGLAAWQSHISGDGGSVGVDPLLDAGYVSTNALCVGAGTRMGILGPLTTGDVPVALAAPVITAFRPDPLYIRWTAQPGAAYYIVRAPALTNDWSALPPWAGPFGGGDLLPGGVMEYTGGLGGEMPAAQFFRVRGVAQ